MYMFIHSNILQQSKFEWLEIKCEKGDSAETIGSVCITGGPDTKIIKINYMHMTFSDYQLRLLLISTYLFA